jgi:hypothetical protein
MSAELTLNRMIDPHPPSHSQSECLGDLPLSGGGETAQSVR